MPTLHPKDVEDWFDDPGERYATVRARAEAAATRTHDAAADRFRRHLSDLKLSNDEEYRMFCKRLGLSLTRLKSRPEQRFELFVSRLGDGTIKSLPGGQLNRTQRRILRVVFGAEPTRRLRRNIDLRRLQPLIEAQSKPPPQQRVQDAFNELTATVFLQRTIAGQQTHYALNEPSLVPAVKMLARLSDRWVRTPCELTFEDLSTCPRIEDMPLALFRDLSRVVAPHGLPGWLLPLISATPTCLRQVGLRPDAASTWTRHLAGGKRGRDLPFPAFVSRRAIGQLERVALPWLSPTGLFRAAQAAAMGASVERARRIGVRTQEEWHAIGTEAEERGRSDLLAWLVAHDDLPDGAIGCVFDHWTRRRTESRVEYDLNGRPVHLPPNPSYSLSSTSTAETLSRIAAEKRRQTLSYSRLHSRWKLDRVTLATGETFVMVPLQSEAEFDAEGEAMSNCVGSYFHEFQTGDHCVLSLREWPQESPGPPKTIDTLKRRVTLCVEPDRGVVECAGRGNRDPDEVETAAVRQWASRRGLLVDALTAV